jgi:hypothetical protein
MAPRISPFRGSKAFPALSVRDLLDAREGYHVHLTRLPNVVATAVGRYRRSREDPSKDSVSPTQWSTKDEQPPKTLSNSEVTDFSWPSILVFVDRWLTRRQLLEGTSKDAIVPPRLYLPDGRVVPTCVIYAEPDLGGAPALQNLTFPAGLVGGGYPVVIDVQGSDHVGSVGCLVTDGDLTYALTSRHVTGEPGREIFSVIGGSRVRIGVSDRNQVGKILFQKCYSGWPGEFVYANLDVGLIRLDDLRYWTAQVYGMGVPGPLVDLNTANVTLDLIGCRVRGFGGASGELEGEIQGLFYRYRSVGGFDYVTDVLIGPLDERHPVRTVPGDSGTLWFCERENGADGARRREREYHPLAVQWGGHRFLEPGGTRRFQFALGAFLSTVCRELDVFFVPDLNTGHSEYWGKLGHYKIAAKACELVSNKKLKKLLMANQKRIAYGDDVLGGKLPTFGRNEFVPLSDVADIVWRSTRGKDKANHFADMDQKGKSGKFKGKTLLDLCKPPSNVDAAVWAAFYDDIGATKAKERGALPFRVWQMFDLMVDCLKKKDVAGFICAGGTMAHYAGDACQPLHVSQFHDGRTDAEKGVHSAYETAMVDANRVELVNGVNTAAAKLKAKPKVKNGKEAARAVVDLMRATSKALPAATVIDVYIGVDKKPKAMWSDLKDATIATFVRGAENLAMLWESAWKQGGGDKLASGKLVEIPVRTLKTLYNDKQFVLSMWLDEMVAAGIGVG